MTDWIDDRLFQPQNKYGKRYKYFQNPCFMCECVKQESDGDYGEHQWYECSREHGEYGRKDFDDGECGIFEHWSMNKQGFPLCEAPNKCLRQDYWKPMDFEKENEHFCLYISLDHPLDYEFGGGPYSKFAHEIAQSVSDFNSLMRNYRPKDPL